MAFNFTTDEIDLTTATSTAPARIVQSGVLVIQPIGTGTGTATIEVSANGSDWVELDPLTTGYDVTEPVTVDQCAWEFWRISVPGTGTGLMAFTFNCKI